MRARLTTAFLKNGFGSFGKGSIIFAPSRVDGLRNIYVGDNVTIRAMSWLCALKKFDTSKITIGNGCYMGHFFHCTAMNTISIGEKVLIADKVFITDNSHGFQDINIPFMDNPLESKGSVSIGDGTWIGENVCILGASIGSHSIIGANSVVTNNIPGYSIAVGNPAKVIRTYDEKLKRWNKL